MKAPFRTAGEKLRVSFGRGLSYLLAALRAVRQKRGLQKSKGPLGADELVKRLTLASPDLVEELYKLSKEFLASEAARENNLNGKATSLLTASGLSLTVAFTFGGLLLQHPEYLDSWNEPWPYVVPSLYGFALLMGLSASGIAVRSLLIRDDYKGIAEEDVFNPEVLANSDSLDFVSLPAPAESKGALPKQVESQEDASSLVSQEQEAVTVSADGQHSADQKPAYPKSGTTYYRRFITAHLWQIAQEHFRIHEDKAKRIKLGQVLFLLFLVVLGAIGVILAGIAFSQQQERIKNRKEAASSTRNLQDGVAQHPLGGSSPHPVIPTTTVSLPSAADGGMLSGAADGGMLSGAADGGMLSGAADGGMLSGAADGGTTPKMSDAGTAP
jgi:hypothetical protein